MKRILLAGAILSIAVYTAVAQSATPPSATERKLLKDVAALKAQVKALKKSETDTRNLALGIGVIGACNTVITADGLQGTWQVVDQLAAATQAGKTYFGPQTPVNDRIGGEQICSAIGVNRLSTLPPNTSPFSALLAIYQSPLRAAMQVR
jgi:hypothetical protein